MNSTVNTEPVKGQHEAAICEGGEGDLHKHFLSCAKNPEHENFIPIDKFTPAHLQGYEDMADVIKTLAELTVMINVKFTSHRRPAASAIFEGEYPFYSNRGQSVLRVGTGRVSWVPMNSGDCRCEKCLDSATPSKKWGSIWVLTATHVVFDDSEAKHTTCVLGYDTDKSKRIALQGWKVKDADFLKDKCEMIHDTCDEDLLRRFDALVKKFESLHEQANQRYKNRQDKKNLSVIVSHPHGCPKQVTVGHWTRRHQVDEAWSTYTYTTDTCVSSSGAFVYLLTDAGWLSYPHVHAGTNTNGNFSAEGRDW